MDTKKKSLIVVAVVAFLLFIFLCISMIVYHFGYNKILVSVNGCENLFDMSAEDFCKTNGKGTVLEDGYTYAKIKNGYLVLILSDYELMEWKCQRYDIVILQGVLGESKDIGVSKKYIDEEDDWAMMPFINNAHACGFDISDDYKRFVAEGDDDRSFFPFVGMGCWMMQLFEGTPSDEITWEYINYGENGEIKEHIRFPEDTTEPVN